MQINHFNDASPYEAPKHHGMTAFRLQGGDASQNEHFWCGLSLFLPGGGADWAASPTEKVYVVLDGQITVITETDTATLGARDSCRIAPGENRKIENRGKDIARMIVISANAKPGARQ